MAITQEQVNVINDNLFGQERIKPYEELFGRKIITPRDYKHIKDDMISRHEAMMKWERTARCICDCGCEVSLKKHSQHKKTKKHKDLMEKQRKLDKYWESEVEDFGPGPAALGD